MDHDQIIDKYYQNIFKLCLFYLNNPEEAQDLLQEIFIKIMKKSSTFEGKANIYTWIYRIAINTLINYINRKKILQFVSFENIIELPGKLPNENFSSSSIDPAFKMEKKEIDDDRIKKLKKCLGLLSNREKTAFYLFYYDQIKQKEIASIMNTSLSAVESLIHKGMKKIKKCTKKDS